MMQTCQEGQEKNRLAEERSKGFAIGKRQDPEAYFNRWPSTVKESRREKRELVERKPQFLMAPNAG